METQQNETQQNETPRETKNCPKCDEVISSKAKTCPKCRADLRSWPAKHPVLTVLLGLIIFIVLISVLFGKSKEEKLAEEKAKLAMKVEAPIAERTTVDELSDIERNNSVIFEAKYLNKKVEVSGYFHRITGSGNRKYVELTGRKGDWTVGKPDCYPINMDDFVQLKKGDPITVSGFIKKGIFAIEIEFCVLDKN